ncbi:Uncharacterized conserved protein YjiS, DUF1127 family [Rhodovulum sp. ES.010]|uniref:DUF1127 domain-containing protein n=1 Tax=Rhodovulum sp. ES.010 TaxID=1882821 RepID=UPI000929D3C3|nr:DUF1127 domain-containing protein [Rhodovulum sp. ES.010]SIO56638.1 Uncharacterized conserved protein YjiS, DUF1127 family [Rhodovulum sp. ES.010]
MAHIGTYTRQTARRVDLSGLFHRFLLGLGAARQRRRLAELDDALLRDIGLTREQARAEARRPIWDVPPSWLG